MRTAPWRGVTDWKVGWRAGRWIRSPSTSLQSKKKDTSHTSHTLHTKREKNAQKWRFEICIMYDIAVFRINSNTIVFNLSTEFTAFFSESTQSIYLVSLFLFYWDSPSTSEPRPSEPKGTGHRQTSVVQGALQRLARCWSSSTALCKSQRPIEFFFRTPPEKNTYAKWISTFRLKRSQDRLQYHYPDWTKIRTAFFLNVFCFLVAPCNSSEDITGHCSI